MKFICVKQKEDAKLVTMYMSSFIVMRSLCQRDKDNVDSLNGVIRFAILKWMSRSSYNYRFYIWGLTVHKEQQFINFSARRYTW